MVSKNSIPTRVDNARRNYYFEVNGKSLKAVFSRHLKTNPLVVQNFNLIENAKNLYPKAQRAIKLIQKITK